MRVLRRRGLPGTGPLSRPLRIRRGATTAALIAVTGVLTGPVDTVVAHEGNEAVVEIEPSRIVAGSTTRVLGDGFTPGTTVSLTLLARERLPLGTADVDAEGHFATEFTSDEDWAPRPYEVSVVADDGGTGSGFFTVLEPTDDSNGPAPSIAAAIGLTAVCSVTAALAVARRRSRRSRA